MYFIKLNITILFCFFVPNAFGLFTLGNGYKYFLKKFNATLGLLNESSITTKWIEQPLDHFNESETRTWRMRYFERLDFWIGKGPIYLYINGEGPASEIVLQSGIISDLANETHGAMYLTEHRYYGKSKPFENMTTENLAYLSSRQALADIAKLLGELKMSPQYKDSKVVVVGGSYAGNLAAWIRLLYPQLVDAAIASSAPVLAKKDFYEYLENVSDDFEQHGTPQCYETIVEIFKRYDELFKTDSGIAQLKEEENICNHTDMTTPENRQLFFLDKSFEFMVLAQYGSPESIKHFCDRISDTLHIFSTNDEADLWDDINDCFDYNFDRMVKMTKHVAAFNAWTYQTCTEFGYFITTSSSHQPFTHNIPVDFYYRLCTKMYGLEFNEQRIDESIEHTNAIYGGLKPNLTNVVFVNGELDPYHRLGVLEDISYDAPAKLIPLSSHCSDLNSDSPSDPEELKEARKYIKYLIKKWIGAGEYKKP